LEGSACGFEAKANGQVILLPNEILKNAALSEGERIKYDLTFSE